jgi:diacylglycerol kinase (ATP)
MRMAVQAESLMRVTLMHNPRAGDRLAAEHLTSMVRAAGYGVAYRSMTEPRGIEHALQDPGDLVVVAGGDGAVKAVAAELAGRGVPMAILPLGTANNVAKAFGILGPARELIAGWAHAERRTVDLCVARAPWGGTRFIESVGGGVFARLIARAAAEVDENPAVWTGNEIDRALQLLKQIVERHPAEAWRLALDGRDLSGEYLLVEAMNVGLIGPNVPLAPAADPGDGALDVVTVRAAERDALVAYIAARLQGHGVPLDLAVHRGRELRMTQVSGELHADDVRWPHEPGRGSVRRSAVVSASEPIELAVTPGALELLVPPA